jgi:integrase
MASLTKDAHTPPKSPYWIACYDGIGHDGKVQRFKRSTKTTDRKLAQDIANKWEAAEKLAGKGRLTESYFRKVCSDIYERVIGEPLHFRSCHAFLTEWLAARKAEIDQKTFARYERVIRAVLEFLGSKAQRQLREITPVDVRKFRDKLATSGRTANTVNGLMNVLRMAFKSAHDAGYVEVNPCAQVKMLKNARSGVKDVFTEPQIAALIKAAPHDDWRGLILCGYLTGLRLSDCAQLQWSNVDLDKGLITSQTRKTGKVVHVPLHPTLATWLCKQTRGIGKAQVFRSLAGTRQSKISEQFSVIVKRAGIRGRLLHTASGAGHNVSSLTFHSLRHSFNSAMANAGVALEVRQKLTGHASAQMNAQYTHHELAPLRAAIGVIPSIKI